MNCSTDHKLWLSWGGRVCHCCDSVLTLIKDPPIAAEIGKTRLNEAIEVGAHKVLALCPCCEFQLRVSADKKNVPVEVVDLSAFAAQALGFTLPDPHPEVKAQWAVFEAMITLRLAHSLAILSPAPLPSKGRLNEIKRLCRQQMAESGTEGGAEWNCAQAGDERSRFVPRFRQTGGIDYGFDR